MEMPSSKPVFEHPTRLLSQAGGLTFLCSSGLMKTRSSKVIIILLGPLNSWLFKMLCLGDLENHSHHFLGK